MACCLLVACSFMPSQQWRTAIGHINYLGNYVRSNTVARTRVASAE